MTEPSTLRYCVGLILAEGSVVVLVAIWLWRVRDGLDQKPRKKDPPWARKADRRPR